MAQRLTPQQKSFIVSQLGTSKSDREIGREAGCVHTTVSNLRKKWEETGSIEDRPRSGRPHALAPQDQKQLERLIKKKRSANAAELTDDMQRKLRRRINERTIRRERRALGFHPAHAHKRPLLTEEHERKRLEFAQVNLHTDWKYVVFDDESHYSCSLHGTVYWIRKGEPRPYEMVSQTKYHTSVWAAMSWNSKFPLRFYQESLDSALYTQILQHNLVPHYPQRTVNRLYYLAHDNARAHIARNTEDFLAQYHIPLLPD
jgi:transposase